MRSHLLVRPGNIVFCRIVGVGGTGTWVGLCGFGHDGDGDADGRGVCTYVWDVVWYSSVCGVVCVRVGLGWACFSSGVGWISCTV